MPLLCRKLFIKSFVIGGVLISGVLGAYSAKAGRRIPAVNVIALDRVGQQRNLQDILNQILPSNSVVLADITATASEINQALDGISGNVTAANLGTLTGGGATTLHTHAGTSATLDETYDNDTTGDNEITIDNNTVSFDLADATNDPRVDIDNTTTGVYDDALVILTSGAGGTITDAIDATDDGITTAINIGSNNIDGTSLDIDGDGTLTGVWDFGGATSLEVPNAAAPTTDATGELALDTSITNHTPLLQYESGTEDMLVIAIPTDQLTSTDGQSITYNATDDEFEMTTVSTTKTLDEAYDDDTSDDAEITVDSGSIDLNLADATNDYNLTIDNTSTGEIADALIIQTGGAGATFVDGIDLSDGGITNAFNLGGNAFTGTALKWDGVGQLSMGAGGGGGNNVGTGIVNFVGGGTIDSTADGNVVLAPDDAGKVVFPSGVTVLLPPASPSENAQGLYWDNGNERLCIDKSTDVCISLTSNNNPSLDDAYNAGQSITVDTGAGLTLTNGASQSLVLDSDTTNSTETNGVLDINVGTTTASVNAIEIALTQDSGATANAENVGVEMTLTGDDADGELVGIDIIGAATANATTDTYTAAIRIDNAEDSANSMTDAILITSSGVDAGVTDAIDVSAANITNAINIGANNIEGTNFKFDGVGQLELGTGGGGGGGTGTAVISFIGGGTFDSTEDGDLNFAPQDAGIVNFPSGTTVRLPQASPIEDRNGIFWDEVNLKLCIDRSTDLCTGALTLFSMSLNGAEMKSLNEFVKNTVGFQKLSNLVANPINMDKLSALANIAMTPEQKDKLLAIEKLVQADIDRFSELAKFDPEKLKNIGAVIDRGGHLYNVYKDRRNRERVQFVETSAQPYLFDRGSAKLVDGQMFIQLSDTFLSLVEIDSRRPQFKVQLTPTSMSVKGTLVAEKGARGFMVFDAGGASDATFDWEVAAPKKYYSSLGKFPEKEVFEKKFVKSR